MRRQHTEHSSLQLQVQVQVQVTTVSQTAHSAALPVSFLTADSVLRSRNCPRFLNLCVSSFRDRKARFLSPSRRPHHSFFLLLFLTLSSPVLALRDSRTSFQFSLDHKGYRSSVVQEWHKRNSSADAICSTRQWRTEPDTLQGRDTCTLNLKLMRQKEHSACKRRRNGKGPKGGLLWSRQVKTNGAKSVLRRKKKRDPLPPARSVGVTRGT
jgi:hypothetical protein